MPPKPRNTRDKAARDARNWERFRLQVDRAESWEDLARIAGQRIETTKHRGWYSALGYLVRYGTLPDAKDRELAKLLEATADRLK